MKKFQSYRIRKACKKITEGKGTDAKAIIGCGECIVICDSDVRKRKGYSWNYSREKSCKIFRDYCGDAFVRRISIITSTICLTKHSAYYIITKVVEV